MVFEGLWYRCALCDLKTRLSCSDSPATFSSPNMGRFVVVVLELLLFVACSFSLGGGTSRTHSGQSLALRALWTCASSAFLSSAVVTYCCW